MKTFVTESGSEYRVDEYRCLVTGGGHLYGWKPYVKMVCTAGYPAQIDFADGEFIRTSRVTAIYSDGRGASLDMMIPTFGLVTIETRSGTHYTFDFNAGTVQSQDSQCEMFRSPKKYSFLNLGKIGDRAQFYVEYPELTMITTRKVTTSPIVDFTVLY